MLSIIKRSHTELTTLVTQASDRKLKSNLETHIKNTAVVA